MPGVTTTTATRSGPVNPSAPAEARYFQPGLFDRGPVGVAVRVRSLAELEAKFGARVSYGSSYDDLRTFFEEGGAEAYVTRVVGPAATQGLLNLNDRGVAPVPTLKIEALSAGAWSTGVTVAVVAGTLAGTFKIVVDGPIAGDTETYNNLTTPADAVAALAKSSYVRATDLGSAAAAPANQPALIAAAPLSAGADDRAAVTASDMAAALDVFGADLEAGVVAIPGFDSSLVGADAIAHCVAHGRIYLGATELGASTSDAKAAAEDLLSGQGDHGAIVYPWVQIPMGGGASKLVSPEGYAAAMRARAHIESGPWQAPAGEIAQARFVTGLEVELNRAQGDDLNENHVSAIRRIGGTVRLYGWRSLSSDVENFYLLTGRDVLNTVKYRCEAVLEAIAFKTIDSRGKVLGTAKTSLIGVVEPMRAAGGLFEGIDEVTGNQIDNGYSVDVGPTVNPLASLRQNRLAAVVAVRPSPTAELINLSIVKAGLTAAV